MSESMQMQAADLKQPRQLEYVTAAELEPLEELMDDGFPPTWRDIATSLYVYMLDTPMGLAASDKAALCILLTMRLAKDMGGRMRYIPTGYLWDKKLQAEAIVAAFSGNNFPELASAHALTESRLRAIVNEEREKRLGKFRKPLRAHKPKQMRARKKHRVDIEREQFLSRQAGLEF